MVFEQKTARKQGAPNSCCHRTIPTVSKSPSTILVWWPMPGCSFRPPWPGISACPNSSGSASTWAMPRGGRRLHRRRRCVAHRQDGPRSRLRSQGALHPGHLPAQLPVGPRPPTGPGEPRVAGLGDGPLTIDLDFTICETADWPKRPPATTATPAPGAITRCWPSPPAPATC